jgi:hypothetical protein
MVAEFLFSEQERRNTMNIILQRAREEDVERRVWTPASCGSE